MNDRRIDRDLDQLAAFIRARLDEVEQVARAAATSPADLGGVLAGVYAKREVVGHCVTVRPDDREAYVLALCVLVSVAGEWVGHPDYRQGRTS
ncbi:MAG TPA: DUF6221 family protein [Pseudonocardiaceae bacterium]|jgi:hypothetical protein|nr:DUF6221 family protein [Pseudonocardiaceae bacterium]